MNNQIREQAERFTALNDYSPSTIPGILVLFWEFMQSQEPQKIDWDTLEERLLNSPALNFRRDVFSVIHWLKSQPEFQSLQVQEAKHGLTTEEKSIIVVLELEERVKTLELQLADAVKQEAKESPKEQEKSCEICSHYVTGPAMNICKS